MHKANSIRKNDVVRVEDSVTDVATILRAINKNLVVAIELLINVRTNTASIVSATGGKLLVKEDGEEETKK